MTQLDETSTKRCLVGIVTYKRESLLRRSIASSQLALPENSDICVVDNSPSAESAEIASQNPDVIWISSKENIGYLAARSLLMGDKRYKYYVSLDDDAWFVRGDELTAAIELLEKDDRTAGVAFDILTPDRPDPVPRSLAPYQVQSFIGCGHVLRLSDFHAVGGYVEAVGYYGSEEKDLSIRLLDEDKSIVLMPGYHVWHDKSELGRDMFAQHRSEVCNDLSFAMNRAPLLLVFPILARKLLLHTVYSAKMRRWRSLGSGLFLFARNIGRILGNRSAVRHATINRFQELQTRNGPDRTVGGRPVGLAPENLAR